MICDLIWLELSNIFNFFLVLTFQVVYFLFLWGLSTLSVSWQWNIILKNKFNIVIYFIFSLCIFIWSCLFWWLCLNQKLNTRVVKKNVNPEWNEDLTLAISDSKLPIKIVSVIKILFFSLFFIVFFVIFFYLFNYSTMEKEEDNYELRRGLCSILNEFWKHSNSFLAISFCRCSLSTTRTRSASMTKWAMQSLTSNPS